MCVCRLAISLTGSVIGSVTLCLTLPVIVCIVRSVTHYYGIHTMTAELEETLRNIKSEIDLLSISELPESEYWFIAKIEDLVDDAIYHGEL